MQLHGKGAQVLYLLVQQMQIQLLFSHIWYFELPPKQLMQLLESGDKEVLISDDLLMGYKGLENLGAVRNMQSSLLLQQQSQLGKSCSTATVKP